MVEEGNDTAPLIAPNDLLDEVSNRFDVSLPALIEQLNAPRQEAEVVSYDSLGKPTSPTIKEPETFPKRKSGDTLKKDKRRRGVSFAPLSELQHVTAYEVDEDLVISIEFSRPVIGWLLLAVAFFSCVAHDTISTWRCAVGISPYVSSTWDSLGMCIVAAAFALLHLCVAGLTPLERRYFSSREGWWLLAIAGVTYAFSNIAQDSSAYISGEWRLFTLSSIHPLFITMFGKVFKHYAFVEEVVGTAILLLGFGCAMLPADFQARQWEFATFLGMAQGIYTASFLFLFKKVRAKMPLSILFFAVSFLSLLLHLGTCAINGHGSFEVHPNHKLYQGGMFVQSSDNTIVAFFSPRNNVLWLVSTTCVAITLATILGTLKFLPTITVSAMLCLKPLVTEFIAYILFFHDSTAVWPTQSTEVSKSRREISVFSPWFSAGTLLCTGAAVYLVYVSSIKRRKEEMLVKQYQRRKTPANPYKSKRGKMINSNTAPSEEPSPPRESDPSSHSLDTYYDEDV